MKSYARKVTITSVNSHFSKPKWNSSLMSHSLSLLLSAHFQLKVLHITNGKNTPREWICRVHGRHKTVTYLEFIELKWLAHYGFWIHENESRYVHFFKVYSDFCFMSKNWKYLLEFKTSLKILFTFILLWCLKHIHVLIVKWYEIHSNLEIE